MTEHGYRVCTTVGCLYYRGLVTNSLPQNLLLDISWLSSLISGSWIVISNRLCGLVVRVLGYRSGGPGSIPGTTRKKK
jgi:hypothetical protein